MWEQYQPPGEEPADQPARRFTRPPVVAGGMRPRGAGAFVGLMAAVVIGGTGLAIANSSSDESSDYAGFYDCVAEEEIGEPGLLSPADLCEIGNERPPDYVDNHEYDPFEDSGY